MENSTHHLKSEFKNFDWSLLKEGDYATNGKTTDGRSYSFYKGGTGYPGGSNRGVSIVDENLNEETWEFPDVLDSLFDWESRKSVESRINEIKRALNL